MFEGSDTLSQFDVAVIIIILLSAVLAFLRGFIKETMVLAGWVAATAITIYAYPFALEIAGDMFKASKVVNISVLIGVFLVVLILISVINAMILDNLRTLRLGIFDRSLGFLFGIFRGVAIASVIHFAIVMLHNDGDGPKWLTEGETYNITLLGANLMKDYAGEIKGLETDDIEDIKDQAEDAIHDTSKLPSELKDSLEDELQKNNLDDATDIDSNQKPEIIFKGLESSGE